MATSVHLNEVVIRYYTTITPKEEGSVIVWRDAPQKFNGTQIYQAMKNKGLPLNVSASQLASTSRATAAQRHCCAF